jgi:hypothetical protein
MPILAIMHCIITEAGPGAKEKGALSGAPFDRRDIREG